MSLHNEVDQNGHETMILMSPADGGITLIHYFNLPFSDKHLVFKRLVEDLI